MPLLHPLVPANSQKRGAKLIMLCTAVCIWRRRKYWRRVPNSKTATGKVLPLIHQSTTTALDAYQSSTRVQAGEWQSAPCLQLQQRALHFFSECQRVFDFKSACQQVGPGCSRSVPFNAATVD
eukprot:scaffold149133_cov19-Tisochrysis_lutea.AAC.1